MYNPYNWKIVKNSDSKYNCILDELSCLCAEIDIIEYKQKNLIKNWERNEKKIIRLKEEKRLLLEKLMME